MYMIFTITLISFHLKYAPFIVWTNQSWGENSEEKKNTKKCQIPSQLSYFCVYSVKIVKDEFQVIGCYFLCRSHSKQQKYQYLDW